METMEFWLVGLILIVTSLELMFSASRFDVIRTLKNQRKILHNQEIIIKKLDTIQHVTTKSLY